MPGDPATRPERERTLVFDQIAAKHPRLVFDGAASLSGVPDLQATLTDGERSRLEQALQRTDLPAWTRLELIDAVASAKLTRLASTLRDMRLPRPKSLPRAGAGSSGSAGRSTSRTWLSAPPAPIPRSGPSYRRRCWRRMAMRPSRRSRRWP